MQTQNFYQSVREKTEYIFKAIIEQPFVKKVLDGTLDNNTFIFYIQQDSLYLAEYRRVLIALGSKLHEKTHSHFFINSATDIIAAEGDLHQKFLKDSPEIITHSPTCQLYISYLNRMVHTHPIEIGLAAVLPCFTIYKEVGDYILANQTNKNNPYQSWIDTYGGEYFALVVQKAINICNFYAQATTKNNIQHMEEAFIISSKLEWMFWDSAYKEEKWPI